MDKASFEANYSFEQDYWWFLGRRRIVENLLQRFFRGAAGALVLDAGCGTGIVMTDLEKHACPIGIDSSAIALEFTKKRGHGRLLCGDVCSLPLKDNSLDLITMLGVLYNEGVESDDRAIEEAHRVLKQGGTLVIDEAAYESLQTEHNVSVGGVRRYTRSRLVQKTEKCGFRILKVSHWNMLMLPAFYLIARMEKRGFLKKRYSRLVRIPRLMNAFLKYYLYGEAWALRHIDLPCGPSIVMVAEK